MHTRIQRWGESLAVRIPPDFAADLGLQDNAEVELTVSAGKLIVVPSEQPTLADLLAQITDDNIHGETEWGEPQGREVW